MDKVEEFEVRQLISKFSNSDLALKLSRAKREIRRLSFSCERKNDEIKLLKQKVKENETSN